MTSENISKGQPEEPTVLSAQADTLKQDNKKSVLKGLIKKYPVVFTAFIGVLAATGIFFWKDLQGKSAKAEVEKFAAAQLLENNQEMLKLVCKPLVWSIRSEMLRGNMEQVNLFTTDLVHEKNFRAIHILEPSGNIINSTDKKMEGQSANGTFEPDLIRTDSVKVMQREDELLLVAAPIMGYDKRLATIIFTYSPSKFSGK